MNFVNIMGKKVEIKFMSGLTQLTKIIIQAMSYLLIILKK